MVTRSVSERERAMPQTSKPGPTFAVVAGTWILYLRVVIPDLRKRSVSTFAHQQLATRRDMVSLHPARPSCASPVAQRLVNRQ